MKDVIYLKFNRKGFVSAVKTKPEKGNDFVKITLIIPEKYWKKPELEAVLEVSGDDLDLKIKEFEIKLQELKDD